MRDRENLAGSKLKIPTVQRILERSDKSPFNKGGFRGNVDALITRKGELFDSPFLRDSGGGGGVASLVQRTKELPCYQFQDSHNTCVRQIGENNSLLSCRSWVYAEP